MGRPFPQFDVNTEIDYLYKSFRLGNAMVVLTKENKACGVLTKHDIMALLREQVAQEHAVSDHAEKGKEKTKLGAKR